MNQELSMNANQLVAFFQKPTSESVSYTHLTLPTT